MMVRAGAGTGKTTVLTQRIFRLVKQGVVPANQILAITFTNAAAEEMMAKLASPNLLGDDAKDVTACTFHSYGYRVLRAHHKAFELLPREDLWVYLRRNIEKLGLKYFAKASDPGTFLKTLLDFFDRCNEELVGAADYAAYVDRLAAAPAAVLPRVGESSKDVPPTREEVIERCREIARAFAAVEQMLTEQNVGSFGSLIVKTARLFQTDNAALMRAQGRARMILVDEFQDTNHSQLEIVRLLAGADGNVFVVGDPDQAIYRFRGASAGAFDDFRKAFPKSKAVTLAENQRSIQNILDCAYEAIRHNADTSDLESDFARLPLQSGRMLRHGKQSQKRVQLVRHDGPQHEAHEVVRLVKERADLTGDPWSEFAVIYRGHGAAPALIEEFGRQSIPVSVAGTDLLDTERGRDLIAALGCMVTLDDNVGLFRLAMMPRFGLDPRAVQRALKQGRRRVKSVAAALEEFDEGKRFIARINQYRKEVESSEADKALARTIELLGFGESVETVHLQRFAGEWMGKPCVGAKTNDGRLADFMDYIGCWRSGGGRLNADERDVLGALIRRSEEPVAVKLMTVHAAKGLEFKHTFIVRTTSNTFPAKFREVLFDFPQELRRSNVETLSEKQLHQEEERRLFYVALTRAKDELFILGKSASGKDPVPSLYMRELHKSKRLDKAVEAREAAPYVIGRVAASAEDEVLWHELPAEMETRSLRLSASAIETYDNCPKQFYFQYEWSLPYDSSAISQYGSAVHLALRTLYDSVVKDRVISLQSLIECFEAEFQKYERIVEERLQYDMLLAQGRQHLSEFYSREIASGALPKVKALEERFSFLLGDVLIEGRIDRVDETEDGLVILDYKTGNPRNEEKTEKSLQLSVYALAATEKWGSPVTQVGFYNLQANQAVFSKRTENQLQATKEKIAEVAAGIRAGEVSGQAGTNSTHAGSVDIAPCVQRPRRRSSIRRQPPFPALRWFKCLSSSIKSKCAQNPLHPDGPS